RTFSPRRSLLEHDLVPRCDIAYDGDDLAHELVAIGSSIQQRRDLLVNVARNQSRADIHRAPPRKVNRPEPVWNGFVAHAPGNDDKQMQTDAQRTLGNCAELLADQR